MQTKEQIRTLALGRRTLQSQKDLLSRRTIETIFTLPEFTAARTLMIYADARSEVRTRQAFASLLESGRRIVVPWCEAGQLRLLHLLSVEDLASGSYGILEPRIELRGDAARIVAPEELDLVVVPGVAFDRHGGRIGHGRGYFDKLLAQVRSDATVVGLAFECQLFDQVPMDHHDVRMDVLVTEMGVYRRRLEQPGI